MLKKALASIIPVVIFAMYFFHQHMSDWKYRFFAQAMWPDESALRTTIEKYKIDYQYARAPIKNLALAEFGNILFHSKEFSLNKQVSCATCHIKEHAFADQKPVSMGIGETARNTPAIFNLHYSSWMFWDGRADTVALQIQGPIEHPQEHGVSRLYVAKVLAKKFRSSYEKFFGKFPKIVDQLKEQQAYPSAVPLNLKNFFYIAKSEVTHSKWAPKIISAFNENWPDNKQKAAFYKNLLDTHNQAWVNAYKRMNKNARHEIDRIFINFTLAVSAYELSIVSADSPFDRFAYKFAEKKMPLKQSWVKGFTEAELRGFWVFNHAGKCNLCHFGPNFTNNSFHNNGMGSDETWVDTGRLSGAILYAASPHKCQRSKLLDIPQAACEEGKYLDLSNPANFGAFKTPTLRNLAKTAPYGHDGSLKTLDEVLEHYRLIHLKKQRGHIEGSLRPLQLSQQQKQDLKLFLNSLNGSLRDVSDLTRANTH